MREGDVSVRKNFLNIFYLLLLFISTLIFAQYLTQPFIITGEALLLIMIGCLIEYFFVNKEELEKFSTGSISILLIVVFSNIQTMILGVTLMVLFQSISKYREEPNIIKKIRKRDNAFNWSIYILSGFIAFKAKAFAGHYNIGQGIDYIQIVGIIIVFVFAMKILKRILFFLREEFCLDFKKESVYGFYSALACFLSVYAYYDRGLLMVLVIYVFLIPFQKVNNLYSLYKEQEKYAHIDDLTGVYNGRYLRNSLLDKLGRDENFCIVMFDLDEFKEINDIYGHLAGDLALKEFAAKLQSMIRKDDFVSRYGGDEFIVVLENFGDCEGFVKRIENTLKDIPVSFEKNSFHINTSYGIYKHKGKSKDIDYIIKQADKSLYESKENKKNSR